MKLVSLNNLIIRFKWRISFTFLLIIVESLLTILYPLLIGLAINDLIDGKYQGIMNLTIFAGLSLLIGSARRFYDTRIYAGIYRVIAPEMVASEFKNGSSLSTVSARSSLINEFVEFLENSMPEVVGAIVTLVGVLSIIAALNIWVFFACLALLFLVAITYTVSWNKNFRLNSGFNNELEKRVSTLVSKNQELIKSHFKELMRWNIKLSDLETLNYFVIYIGVIALFIFTPFVVIESGVLKYGLIFAILMYVFDYIEKVIAFPLYIQQLIRLKEISNRLSQSSNHVGSLSVSGMPEMRG